MRDVGKELVLELQLLGPDLFTFLAASREVGPSPFLTLRLALLGACQAAASPCGGSRRQWLR
jgi:hypothetical protein